MTRPLILALALLAPVMARACEPIPAPGVYEPVDRPIDVQSDGSFTNASQDDEWAFVWGNPVRDIGGGRTGQIIVENLGQCAADERLLFVDCTTGEAIVVFGLPRRMTEMEIITGGVRESTRALQPPEGPLALTSATTVAEIAALAVRQGWTVERDVPAWAAERGAQNAFDPFIGCKILYPNSLGATS